MVGCRKKKVAILQPPHAVGTILFEPVCCGQALKPYLLLTWEGEFLISLQCKLLV